MTQGLDIEVTCPACSGKGHVRKFLIFRWLCPVCEGTGSLTELDPFQETLRIEGVMRAVLFLPTLLTMLGACAGITMAVLWIW